MLAIVLIVRNRRVDAFKFFAAEGVQRSESAQAADDVPDLALQQHRQPVGDERRGLGAALGMEALGGRPESLEHMKEIEHAHRPRQPLACHLPEGALAVEQADERLVPLGIPVFAGDRHLHEYPFAVGRTAAIEAAGHLGPRLFVLWRRPVLCPLFSADLVHDVGRGPREAIDAAHGPHIGHLLLVGLLALAPPGMRSMRPLCQRLPHRHPLAVGGGHKEFTFCGRFGW